MVRINSLSLDKLEVPRSVAIVTDRGTVFWDSEGRYNERVLLPAAVLTRIDLLGVTNSQSQIADFSW